MPRQHHSTIYHVTSQWIVRSELHLELLLTQCEETRAFEVQNHVNYMYISHFRCGVDHLYFVLEWK